jgi:hypothetical protein
MSRPDLAKETNLAAIGIAPGSLIANTANTLNAFLSQIENADYPGAFVQLVTLAPYWRETVAQHVIDTFLLGIDWRNLDDPLTANRLETLETGMQTIMDNAIVPVHRDIAACILSRRHQKAGDGKRGIALLETVLDNGNELLDEYAMTRIARMCERSDPTRAIALYERYRSKHGRSAGAVYNVLNLAKAYLATGDVHGAKEVYEYLESRRDRGEIFEQGMAFRPRIGLMTCADQLGNDQEKTNLANELLEESGYDPEQPLTELKVWELDAARSALKILGRSQEAQACDEAISLLRNRPD